MLDFLKNNSIYLGKYKTHSEAVIVACYFNPQNSPYRKKAFDIFYESIKHLNHRIVECVIGGSSPHLPVNESISRVFTNNLLWHKETLLNNLIKALPAKFKYVFWIDADVIFENKNWLVEGVDELKHRSNIIQPFEYCVHLEKDELKPSFDMAPLTQRVFPNDLNSKVWKSFCSNYARNISAWRSNNYNIHGHVGFAWGADRDVLDKVPLFDHALTGGADHIIAHAATGQIGHECIRKSFTDNLEEIDSWSLKFCHEINGCIGYVPGNLFHIWHGDIEKRQYLKRVQDFTPKNTQITQRDSSGLFIGDNESDQMMADYFAVREVTEVIADKPAEFDGFGGGDFGGGGAGASYDQPAVIDHKPEDNFS